MPTRRKRKRCSSRMVCGGLTVANADCAYDPHPPCAVYSELCIVAVNDHDRDRDDCRDRIAVSPLASYLQLQALPLSYFRGWLRFWQGI